MKVNSQDISEVLAGTPDFEALFMAEMQARRERLAKWIQLIQDEVRLHDSRAVRTRRSHQCRALATPRHRRSR
jgi:hypothetical protein